MKFSQFMQKSELMALHALHQRVFQELQQGLRLHDLNLHEALVCLALFFEQGGTVNPSDLVKSLGLQADQMSQALRRLEERNLIRRKIAEADGRRRQVVLTAPGRRLGPLLVGLFDRMEQKLEQGVFQSGRELLQSRFTST